jgi:4-amino-4-deoxy-L-arabinose transferase-like glycosyltransferase
VSYRGWRVIATLVIVGLVAAGLVRLGRNWAKDPRDALVDGSSGSWWFPRGGPYILGFDSPGPATLAVDGETIVTGQGQNSRRLIYEEGVHSVVFQAPPGARLLWHPPGRRGALEYVSASSLSKEPAERAQFTAPGTDPQLAGVAAALLAIVLLGALKLARPFEDGRVSGPGMLIFVVALTARVWGLGAAGQTWDEDEYWSSGRNYVDNLFAGDFSDRAWAWNQQHPPVTKYLAGVGALADDGFTAARIIFAVLGAGACVLAFAAGRRLFGGRAGFFAGMTCALLPHLVGHGRIVGHETPSVFFWTLAVWLALAAADDEDRPGWQALRFVTVGMACGLAIGTRFPNLLCLPVVAAAALVPLQRHVVRSAAVGLAVIPLATAATFVGIWPRMWSNAIPHLRAAWDVLKIQHLPEIYLGREVQAPPWHYFPVYLAATTPILVLGFAVLFGGARAVWKRERAFLLVAVWLLAPFGIAFSPVRQDGMRYLLPVLVPVAIAAGAGLDLVMARAPRVVFLLGLFFVGYLGYTCRGIAPYYIDYFNEVVGGPKQAQARHLFDVGWWGEGLAEAVETINDSAARDAAVARLVQPTHVTWLRGDLWRRLSDDVRRDTDWILVNDLWIDSGHSGWTPPPDFQLARDVQAAGASLARVYRRYSPGSTR